MKDWTEVVTHPLGLAGFALFVVFGLLARRGVAGSNRWLAPAAVAMAFVALFGGLGLAYRQASMGQDAGQRETGPAASKVDAVTSEPAAPSGIVQQTTGAQSPAVADVKGNVELDLRGTVAPAAGKEAAAHSAPAAAPPAGQASRAGAARTVEQHTSGAQSPAVSGVGGNVTISIEGQGGQGK